VLAFLLLGISVGAINLGSKVAVLVRGNRDGELVGGIVGLLTLLILAAIMLQLGLLPRKVLASSLDCPWLRGC
jgi:hypothetical protein